MLTGDVEQPSGASLGLRRGVSPHHVRRFAARCRELLLQSLKDLVHPKMHWRAIAGREWGQKPRQGAGISLVGDKIRRRVHYGDGARHDRSLVRREAIRVLRAAETGCVRRRQHGDRRQPVPRQP